MVDNKQYWAARERELKRIEENIRNDQEYNRRLGQLYNRIEEDIKREIERDIESFATREGISAQEAHKRISRVDIEDYKEKAKRYVEERDFSSRANREMRIYNVTMRTNRWELLRAKINLNTVALANEEEFLLQEHLSREFIKEYERQAGILGYSIPSLATLKVLASAAAAAEFHNTRFSERIWQNQRELQVDLEKAIHRVVIQGQNSRKAARDLRKHVREEIKKKKYVSERLATTEAARVMTQAQKKSFEDMDFEEYIYISEADSITCPICADLDGKVFKVRDMTAGENAAPMHPFAVAQHQVSFREMLLKLTCDPEDCKLLVLS